MWGGSGHDKRRAAAGEGWVSSSHKDGRRRRAACDDDGINLKNVHDDVGRCTFVYFFGFWWCVPLTEIGRHAAAVIVLHEVCVKWCGTPSPPLHTLLFLLR